MSNIVIQFNEMQTAISVMKEVSAWGREQGYRVWPDEWLTPEELVTPNAPKYEATYLHKFCVRRKFAGTGMTNLVVDAIKKECRKRRIRYIRLDTALDEKAVRKIYLNAGFKIVDIIDYPNGRSLALYELEVKDSH
ncbi:MAG: GNAT family N-acetyltransferase [Lachnospiraceae bacterium]|nr:GNAT family N-acetyltransferase [Lachnospiraceae bacterium]